MSAATAVSIRDTWLDYGITTGPSHRTTAESAVAQLYVSRSFSPPDFVWVPSPPAGVEFAIAIANGLAATPVRSGEDRFESPSAHLACMVSALRSRMDKRIRRLGNGPDAILRQTVWNSLRTTLIDGVASAVRTLMLGTTGSVTWYGQQEGHRFGYYDAYRRLGLIRTSPEDDEVIDLFEALARSTGWWWSFENVCIMAERPVALHTEAIPGRVDGERLLHADDEPALQFADGHCVYVQHGTVVPDWVIREPTVERIAHERNVEVRRVAIERLGWDRYISSAGLALIDRATDPGNEGCALELYSTPQGWGLKSRILLATNGSRERDGHRRRYGLQVPHWIPSALDAAGWTYGITGTDYAQLVRRT